MPPKRQRSGTTTHATNGAPRSMAAKKRKNLERSDDDDDSDFETPFLTVVAQTKPQKKPSSKSRSKNHVPTLPSDSSSLSLENEKQGRRGGSTAEANGQEKETRKGTVEMKRAKRSMVTEEDRGFVFTRKLPSTPAPATASVPATTTTSKARNGGSTQEPELARPTTPLPPSPERTPSREAYTHGPSTKTKLPKSQDHRSKPVASSITTKTATVASTSRFRHQPQYTPERATDVITAIPMRETPMIKKNKDLRSGSRRSSFAMRGKRASTIGNGFSALPHPSVDPKSFYRHISADEPPPVRMKQLMAWCARKTIDNNGEKRNETGQARSATALKIARLVEEEALAMLMSGKFSVSWYSRPADIGSSKKDKPKKPHAQNVSNLKRLQEYEAQMAKLKQEDDQWTKVITSYNNFHAALLDEGPALPPGNEPIMVPETFTEDIELDLLTADERSLWDKHIKHNPTIASKTGSSSEVLGVGDKALVDKKWMTEVMSSLEMEVDQLRDTLYVASRFDKVTRQYTDQVLEQIAIALDERQRPRIEPPPTLSSSSTSSSTTSSFSSTTAPSSSLKPPSHSVLSPDVVDDPREILRALSRLSL
ncbi:hypothetical protein MVEG_12010 [Podila verticillata NRRL 6337]|uniref:Kinetochore protein Mis13/DSN1 n=1 Tax=Podila verticillata NRRL 6337 TaxID=1069443 RepID=A0A086TKZ1_9FUNG|nr:hypothetical protein MVEG_12010 [Podila verticillata NRRL 6337]